MDHLNDDELHLQIFGIPRRRVKIPDGAIDLFPSKIDPRILHLPDTNQTLKAGSSVKMSEAEAMRLIARETSIPVPKVQDAYVKDEVGYIIMSREEGKRLGDVWKDMDNKRRISVISQLRGYVEELQRLPGSFYGAPGHQPCEDIFFSYLPFEQTTITYGPFESRSHYNKGLIDALKNSCPGRNLEECNQDLATRLLQITDGTIVFSHGDLHPFNILVDERDRITAILDWECSGFSIPGRDYYEAKARSQGPAWRDALDEVFKEEAKVHFELLRKLDRILVRYTLI